MEVLIANARKAAEMGNWAQAERIALDLLALQSRSLDALEIVILARRNAGDVARAEALLRQAIDSHPDRRWPYGDLARMLIEQGRKAEAEQIMWAAIRADRSNADALMLLGLLELERGLLIEAEGHLHASIALVGRHPGLVMPLARAVMLQGRMAEARNQLEPLAAKAPAPIEVLALLAELEERSGNFPAALDHLHRAGQSGEGDTDLLRSVVLARMGRVEDALGLLEGRPDLSGPARLQRGRLRDRSGRHGEAWHDWTEGKARIAAAEGRRYPADELHRDAAALLAFAQRHRSVPPGEATGGSQPVFVLGFPRSGTTLTEQILSAHDAVLAGGELPFGPELRDLAASRLGGEQGLLAWLEAGGGADMAEALRDHYLTRAAHYRLVGPNRYFTDKMPLNELWLPLIRLAFPQAPVVRIVRHPLDVLVSAMSHDMTHGHNFAYRLEDAVQHMLLIDRQLRGYAEAGLKIDHVLRYEDLIADQHGETARLMEMLGLDLQPRQLEFHREARVAPTPSYAQVQEPLNARAVGRWRNFSAELSDARQKLATLIAALGYEA